LVQIATKYYAVLLRSSKIFVILDSRQNYAMKKPLLRNAMAVMAIIRLRLKK